MEKRFNEIIDPAKSGSVKPDFLCVGAQKAGTTSFYDWLKTHPDIFLSEKKEVHFFDIDQHYQKGHDWYNSHFKDKGENQIAGEVSPDYMIYGFIPDRMLEYFGKDIKLIFILRHPVDRAYSQFNFHILKGVESRSDFLKCIESTLVLNTKNLLRSEWYDPPYYIERGLYYNQLKRFYDRFPKENILVIVFEELFGEEREKVQRQVFDFLKIPPTISNKDKKINVSRIPSNSLYSFILYQIRKGNKSFLTLLKKIMPHKAYSSLRSTILPLMEKSPPKLDKNIKSQLFEKYYSEDIKKLSQLTGRNYEIWTKGRPNSL